MEHYVQQVSSFTLLASPNSLKSCLAHFTLLRLNFTVNINLWLSSLQRSHGEWQDLANQLWSSFGFITRPGKSWCNILMSQAVWQVINLLEPFIFCVYFAWTCLNNGHITNTQTIPDLNEWIRRVIKDIFLKSVRKY